MIQHPNKNNYIWNNIIYYLVKPELEFKLTRTNKKNVKRDFQTRGWSLASVLLDKRAEGSQQQDKNIAHDELLAHLAWKAL